MITVAGEALVDLVIDRGGAVSVHAGGSSLNVARTISRLGVDCRFLGRLSEDPFGELLLSSIRGDGIAMAVPERVTAPSTLAVAALDAAGDADYRFYLTATSAGQLAQEDIPPGLAAESDALVVGGLGLLLQPMASTLLQLISQLDGDALLVLDPNCRARAIGDPDTHRALIEGICERADVVKVSAGDLAVLSPETAAQQAARELLARGPRAVLLTDGPAPVVIHCREGEALVPVPDVPVADTVGSGDAFVGAFTAWWVGRGLTRAEMEMPMLERAVTAAVEVAALTCTRAGAQPPSISGWLG